MCALRPDSGAVNMPPKERLTAAQHLAKYGADMAFYVNTEEGANIICKPLPYCRLRGDTRQKVLEYLVCVSDKSGERYALRAQPHQIVRADQIDDPAPKSVRVVAGMYHDVPLSRGVLKRSTAAAVDTLIKHSSAIPVVCKTMDLDHKAVRARPAAINRATPRAWLEHLYCRPSDGDDRAVKKELIARQKAGKAANLTRDLLQRSASTVEFRHARRAMGGARSNNAGPVGGANDGVQIFRCPATWSDAQKEGATTLLGLSHLRSCRADDLSRGLAMTHSRVLTVDEANAKEPCDVEQLIQVTKFSLGGVLDRLKGRTLTVLVTNIKLVQHHLVTGIDPAGAAQAVLTPDDYEAMAADLRGILGSVASDHRLPTAWTNKVPHPYNQYEQGKGDLGKDEFRATVHDPSEPPITSYAELLRVMAENDVKSTSLDRELVWQTESGVLYHAGAQFDRNALFAPQGSTLVDISLPTNLQLHPQMHELDSPEHRRNPYPSHYFVEPVSSVKGARPGSAAFGGGLRIEFKIDTNIEHERGHLEEGRIFVNFGPGVEQGLPRFGVLMYVNIPGMD